MKIVFDPLIIWYGIDDPVYFDYLDKVTSFIDKYLAISYLSTDQFLDFLITLLRYPLGKYRAIEQVKNDIVSRIYKGLDTDIVVNLVHMEKSLIPSGFSLTNDTNVDSYLNDLFGYFEDGNDILFFLSIQNHGWKANEIAGIHYVYHIYNALGTPIADILSSGRFVKAGALKEPTITNPLPNIEICMNYSHIREEYLASGKGDVEHFRALGKEVAFRNGYTYNYELTRINNGAIRDIFSSKTKKALHLSIDFEKGAFELHDSDGHHMGEISYEGKQTGKAKRDHDIKIKK